MMMKTAEVAVAEAGAVAAAAATTMTMTTTLTTTPTTTATTIKLLARRAKLLWPCHRQAVKPHPQTRRAKAGDFKLHRRDDVRTFVLG